MERPRYCTRTRIQGLGQIGLTTSLVFSGRAGTPDRACAGCIDLCNSSGLVHYHRPVRCAHHLGVPLLVFCFLAVLTLLRLGIPHNDSAARATSFLAVDLSRGPPLA